jgi:hypothetical protein
MSFPKKLLTLAAPAALLALSACATGLPTQVSRFQAMPAPQGQSFAIRSADERDRGGLQFAQYADLVRRHLTSLGYTEAPSTETASLIVSLDYGVDQGRQQVRSTGLGGGYGGYGGFGRPRFGFGLGLGFGRYSRFGGYGRYRSPYYWGWDDPFGYGDIDVTTVYTSFVDMDIKRAADGKAVFEGVAKARSSTDDLRMLVPNLVEAMFTGFPGNSGETVRITVPPPPKPARR